LCTDESRARQGGGAMIRYCEDVACYLAILVLLLAAVWWR
jgi:hypothetical protein